MSEIKPLDRLKNGLSDLSTIEVDRLINKQALGPLDFSSFRSDFESVKEFASNLLALPLEILEENRIEAINNSGDNVAKIIQRISDFSVDQQDNPKQTRDTLGQNLRDTLRNFQHVISSDLPLLLLSRKDRSKQEISEQIAEARTLVSQLRDDQKEMEGILEVSRTAAGQIGVDVHSVDFSSLADEHRAYARQWLVATTVFLALAIIVPPLLVWNYPLDGDWSSIANVQKIVAKIAFIFILFFLIAQSAKNYRTHRHLFVVNKHRETSLKTFRTFVKSAETDQAIKTQLLLEAARTIFAPATTGYLANEEENPNNRIIEIMKMVKDTKP